jgi:hypothetical protein
VYKIGAAQSVVEQEAKEVSLLTHQVASAIVKVVE